MSYSNTYLQIKNIIMTKDVVKSLEIGSDYIKVCYYGGCGKKYTLEEPLTEEELNDLVLALNAQLIKCQDIEEENQISEDNC